MKKLIFIFLVFLVSCESKPIIPITDKVPPAPQATIEQPNSSALDTLQVNERCPYLCWMGIKPGVTTFEEAKSILNTSDQIDQKLLKVSNTRISVPIWYTVPTRTTHSNAYITFENGVVNTISFGDPPFKIKDITNLIGEPDKISYLVIDTPDGPGKIAIFVIYFSSRKIMVTSGGWTGPDPNDHIVGLDLNTEFDNSLLPAYGPIQTWLGYGHIKDYLPDVEIPMIYRTVQP
jgi:hypothetical protein